MPRLSSGDQYGNGPNPFIEPIPRISEYTAQQIATLQNRLDKFLGPEYLASRQGYRGEKLYYVPGEKAINLANEVFGFNGWSSSIQNIQIDYVDEDNGKVSIGCSIICRVTLKDGTYHEDIGYGSTKNMPDKASAFQKVKKEAATDSLKRALRNFGNVLGNCIYDRDYLTQVTRIKAGTRRWDPDNFHRHSSYGPIRTENASRESLDKTSKDQGSRPDRPEDDEYGGDAFEDMDFINPDEVCLGTELSPVKKVLGRFEPTRSDRSSTPISEAGPPEQGQGNKAPSRLQSHEQSVPNIPSNQMQRQQPPHLQPQSNLQPTPPRTGPEIRSLAVTSPVRSGAQNNYTIPEPRQQNTLPPANGNISPVQNQGNQTRTNNTSHPSNESEGGAPNSETPIGWFSSKALLNAPASEASTLANITLNPFNPHKPWHGSKTQGVNHNKSAPVKRQIVSQSPQISNNNVQNNRPNFVSPQVDSNRKIGMPAGATPNSLTNRTSYKPPGPAAVKRNADTMTRSVLSDVSNVQNSVQVDAHDSKRQRVEANTKATVDSGTTLGSVGDSENKDKS